MLPYRRNSRKTRSYLFWRIEFHVEFSRCTQNDLLNHWSHTGRRDWNKTINELFQRRARSGVPKSFQARFQDFGQVFLVCSRPELPPSHSIAAREKKLLVPRVRKVTSETKVHGRKGEEFLSFFSHLSLSQSEVNLIVTVTYLQEFFQRFSPAACVVNSWLVHAIVCVIYDWSE